MKDTIEEIRQIGTSSKHLHSTIVANLFEKLLGDIFCDRFNETITLYDVENLLEVFDPAKKEDIEILEQLKEKLLKLNRTVL